MSAGATLIVVTAVFTVDAAYTEMPNAALSARVRAVSRATASALASDPLGCGRTCRYLVTWRDFGGRPALEDGVALALERWGFDAHVRPQLVTAVGRKRVASADDCDATLVVAVGEATIARERGRPGPRELTRVDLSPAASVFLVDLRPR